ncbi:hypothetical protein MMC29_004201 [Sticta canariensis]|nr:hypothetical protein [Sticta canariensis]
MTYVAHAKMINRADHVLVSPYNQLDSPKMGVYRLEIASTGRAICKNKECKDNQIKIEKGSLRFCTQFEVRGNQSWAYKHWGCVTPAQIHNLKETIEDNLEYLDGYDELGPELQGKVEKALKEGHVDDSDWRGVYLDQSNKTYWNADITEDVEQNRPGSKGVRKSASKKKQMAENSEPESHGSATTNKPAPKKRGRPMKNQDADDDDAGAPTPKRPKPASRRGRDDEAEGANANADTLPPKKTKAVSKKSKKAKDVDAEPELGTEVPKVKKGRRGKGKIAESTKINDIAAPKEEISGHDVAPPTTKGRKQPIPKTAGLQEFQSASEEGGTGPESDAFENKSKSQKVRKKPNAADVVVKTKKATVRGRQAKDT